MESIYYVMAWACHRKCRHCYEDRFRPYVRGELEAVVAEAERNFPRIVDHFPARMTYLDEADPRADGSLPEKTGRIILSGGESLLDATRQRVTYPVIRRLNAKYAAQGGVKIVVQTTGDILTDAMVADLIAGEFAEVNYRTVPSVIYTAPEIAWVGKTEEEVKQSGRPYKVGSFPFAASGRARAMESTGGFAKIISAADDDEVLGVHIIGAMAGELIAEAVLAMEYSASTEDIQRTIHAHPTLSEALHEAALAADKHAIDFPNR